MPEKGGNYHGEENILNAPQYKIIKGINDGFDRTAPVGSFDPNKLGIFDLGGNVRELVSDWFSDEKNRVVFRGGSWWDYRMGSLESSYRNAPPTARGHQLGFRCVLERSQ
jgi:formylglycine-generating enzyme required for sulfatase activity